MASGGRGVRGGREAQAGLGSRGKYVLGEERRGGFGGVEGGGKAGSVGKSGAWFSYESQRLGQGRENYKGFLRDNPDIANKSEASIRQNSGLVADRILENAKPGEDDLDD